MARWILSLIMLVTLTACSFPVMKVPDEWSSLASIDQLVPKAEFEIQQLEEEPSINFEMDSSTKKEVQENEEHPEEVDKKDETKKQTIATLPYEKEVVQLVNQERKKYGCLPLKMDQELTLVARQKSADMRDKKYFSHQSPTFGSPFDMLKKEEIDFTMAGENIAAGQRSPKQVVEDWMNSEGHRKNILHPDFTHIGVGYREGGIYGTYWTQLFIKK